jgi:broad specificity phosphatase PhoE
MTTDDRSGYPSVLALVRHGESVRNAIKVGRLEMPDTDAARAVGVLHDHQIPLSPLGERQAVAVGEWIRRRGLVFDRCYDSGYERARETRRLALAAAYPSAASASLSVRSELLLREREGGIFRSMTAADIASHPLLAAWAEEYRRNPLQTRYIGGESLLDVVDRVRHFRDWICTRHPGGRVLVFCHDLVMKAFRIVLMHYDVDSALELALAPGFPNGSIHVYTRSLGQWTIAEAVPHQETEPMT